MSTCCVCHGRQVWELVWDAKGDCVRRFACAHHVGQILQAAPKSTPIMVRGVV